MSGLLRAWAGSALVLALAAGPAAAQPVATPAHILVQQVPATFSQGDRRAAAGLETLEWWKTFNDPVLDGLMARATQGSLSVQQAQARVLQARASLGQANSDRWPTVTASATATRSKTSGNALTPGASASPTTVYQAGFDATWEWDFLGGKQKAAQAAGERLEASRYDLANSVLTLLGDVATNYVSLRGDQALLEITRQSAATQAESARVTEQRFQLGLVSALDVAQAQAQVASTRSDIPSLEASVKRSIHRLGVLCGLDPEALAGELAEARPLPSPQGAISTGLPAELLARRPDLQQAEHTLAAAMLDVGVAKADLYPKFDLTLGLGLESLSSASFLSASSRYWSIVPGLSLPVFNRTGLKAAVAKKEAVYQESLAAFRASYHTALEDVENALAGYYAEQARHHDLDESLRQSQRALDLAQERYQRGLTSFLDVLSAQATLHSAQSSLSKSDAALLTDLVALYKALGGGWAAAGVTSAAANGYSS
jgi:NodT family efflux transporter outer membrane factor (OMF) lipoprotein